MEGGATPGDYVGFANLPDQVHRRAIKRGFEFNLMVVGMYNLRKFMRISAIPTLLSFN